jgi:hypothetical protein
VPGLVREVVVAKAPLDFAGMLSVRGRTVEIARQTEQVRDAYLTRQVRHDAGRHSGGIGEQGAQEADGA